MNEAHEYLAKTRHFLQQAGIVITEQEQQRLEIATFGLPDYPTSGLQLLTYINSPRYCAKELVLFPRQTCPEHRHPPFAGTPGKQETFRCRWGEVFLYVPGPNGNDTASSAVADSHFSVHHQIRLRPGEQYTIEVRQPSHSIVFAFDASGSMGPYLPMIQQSLRSFANGIETGQECPPATSDMPGRKISMGQAGADGTGQHDAA